MDFMSVPDMNPRKYCLYSPNSTGQETSMGSRGNEGTSPEHLFDSAPFKSNVSHISGLPGARRPRADTMPSRTTIFPYTGSTTTGDSDSSSTTYGSGLYLGGDSSKSLINHSNNVGRRRSGSVTLLSSTGGDISRQDYGNSLFTSDSSTYRMMEKNATDTVQSTLATLGLDDTLDSTHTNHYLPSTAFISPHQSTRQQQQLQRHRSYTVATRHPSADEDRRGDMGFSPFSQQTRSGVMQRPRAVSVGMMDDPHFDELNSFSTFGMASLQSSGSQQEHQTHYSQQQQQLAQHVQDTQQLRVSRSSGNLMDISEERIDESAFKEDPTHQDNASPSVSSSTSALLDSPLSAPAHIPSRALWLGNINASLTVNDLIQQFSLYGNVESARILSDKECAFVNFSTVESAVAAKNDLETRLGCKLGGSLIRIGFGKADVTLAMALTNEAGPNAQGPTRALWVTPVNGNIALLQAVFQAFGPIESIRILSHKNCGFVNFEHQEDAVRARKNLQNKEALGPGFGTIRIGFAKAPSTDDLSNAEPGFVSVSPHSQTMASTQYQMYQQQQHPLPQHHLHQNQNFVQQPQNVYHHQQQLSPYIPHAHTSDQQETPSATIPQHNTSGNIPSTTPTLNKGNHHNNQGSPTDTYQATQWATAMTMVMNASGKKPTAPPSLYSAIADERHYIMQQLCHSTDTSPLQQQAQHERPPIIYHSVLPPVPEMSSERMDPLRLRDMRKRLESAQGLYDVEMIAHECMNDIVELCNDYIGNTVIQKLFELCIESSKQTMLERIAPFLATIGVHKNGTWAAQKIIHYANTPSQVDIIRKHIAPYVPLLLLNQFGNYVVQCCLCMSLKDNQFIFDAIVDKCWEIGQGRFGARSVRAILENRLVTKEQQVYCAAAIVQNAVLLTTNANGTLLLMWLLDTSELSGRYHVLYPRLLPYISKLCTHKHGSATIYKIIQQQEDPDTSRLFLNAMTTDPDILDEILRDQIYGVMMVQKIMTLLHISNDKQQQTTLVQLIRASLDRLDVYQAQGYQNLIEELDVISAMASVKSRISQDDDTTTATAYNPPNTATSSTPVHPQPLQDSSANVPMDEEMPKDMVSWMKNPQSVAMMANMYAVAMTSATTTQLPPQLMSLAKVPELTQFNHILKSLLVSSEPPIPSTSSSLSLSTSDSSSNTNKTSSTTPIHSDVSTVI